MQLPFLKDDQLREREAMFSQAMTSPEIHYAHYLNELAMPFLSRPPFLLVGTVPETKHFLLLLSVIRFEMPALLNLLLPYLLEEKVAFTIPAGTKEHDHLLEGRFGAELVGKIITIYPKDQVHCLSMAGRLVELTGAFHGPRIPNVIFIGGIVYRCIENSQMMSVKDMRCISLSKPKELTKKIGTNYLALRILKNDAKGRVLQCLYIPNWFRIHSRILKEGKSHQCSDQNGRSIKDRLYWQFHVMNALRAYVPLPAAYEIFTIDGDTYLAMEHLTGRALSDEITRIYSGSAWRDLSRSDRLLLLGYLSRIVNAIAAMHLNGYVHRDLNPDNFMVSEDCCLTLIDLELSYSYFLRQPSPAFDLGTPGYMSPEQQNREQPGISQDIYGVGSLMVRVLTGLSPTKFINCSSDQLIRRLEYFIPDSSVARTITRCLSPDPIHRPSLADLSQKISYYAAADVQSDTANEQLSRLDLEGTIQKGFKALVEPFLQDDQGFWFSNIHPEENSLANEFLNPTIETGLHSGIAGVLYGYARGISAGFDIGHTTEAILHNLEYIMNNCFNVVEQPKPGLFSGAYGLALLQVSLIEAKIIADNPANRMFIEYLLSKDHGQEVNIADGAAGRGMCTLQCSAYLTDDQSRLIMNQCLDTLISSQQRDGSWLIRQNWHEGKTLKLPGLYHGTAGIAYFLICYDQKYPSEISREAAKKALNWLMKQRRRIDGQMIWTVNLKTKVVNPWLAYGFSGIALTFIKAYENYGVDMYKKVALDTLLINPARVTSNYFNQSYGLAGLGEIYLEASRVFKEAVWQERADWITGLLLHTACPGSGGSLYWLADHNTTATADLMTGQAGILHYLMRCARPEQLNFPLF